MLFNKLTSASSASSIALTYGGTVSSTTDLSSYSLTVPIGPTAPAGVDRFVVIGIIAAAASGTPVLNSVLINGFGSSFVSSSVLAGNNLVSFAYFVVNNGITATCVATYSQTMQRCQMVGYGLVGVISRTPSASQYAFAQTVANVSGATSATVSTARGGASILLATVRNGSGFSSSSGQGTLTSNFANILEINTSNAGWSESGLNTVASQTYSATAASILNGRGIGVITFR